MGGFHTIIWLIRLHWFESEAFRYLVAGSDTTNVVDIGG